jgi:hypothetical protein
MAFEKKGWLDGPNVRIDYSFNGIAPGGHQAIAAEIVRSLQPSYSAPARAHGCAPTRNPHVSALFSALFGRSLGSGSSAVLLIFCSAHLRGKAQHQRSPCSSAAFSRNEWPDGPNRAWFENH